MGRAEEVELEPLAGLPSVLEDGLASVLRGMLDETGTG